MSRFLYSGNVFHGPKSPLASSVAAKMQAELGLATARQAEDLHNSLHCLGLELSLKPL